MIAEEVTIWPLLSKFATRGASPIPFSGNLPANGGATVLGTRCVWVPTAQMVDLRGRLRNLPTLWRAIAIDGTRLRHFMFHRFSGYEWKACFGSSQIGGWPVGLGQALGGLLYLSTRGQGNSPRMPCPSRQGSPGAASSLRQAAEMHPRVGQDDPYGRERWWGC